jgi:hypothetical protein
MPNQKIKCTDFGRFGGILPKTLEEDEYKVP